MLESFKSEPDEQHDRVPFEEELTRRIFDSITNGVAISDATSEDMPLIYVNPAFEKMTGYPGHEVLGKNCRFLQREATAQKEVVDIRAAIRERREICRVLKNYTKDGVLFWNELYLSPVFDVDGRITHYVGIQKRCHGAGGATTAAGAHGAARWTDWSGESRVDHGPAARGAEPRKTKWSNGCFALHRSRRI